MKNKYYAVKRGRIPGVYRSWDEARIHVDCFPSAFHKSFKTYEQAVTWYLSHIVVDVPRPVKSNRVRKDGRRRRSKRPRVLVQPQDSSTRQDEDELRDDNLEVTPFRPQPAQAQLELTPFRPQPAQAQFEFTPSPQPQPVQPRPVQPQAGLSSIQPPASDIQNIIPSNLLEEDEENCTLDARQNEVLQRVILGHNVFFTGSAGVGKSVLLRAIIRALREPHRLNLHHDNCEFRYTTPHAEVNRHCGCMKPKSVAVTAVTGVAALNIGGTTIHSWSGIKTGEADVGQLIGTIRNYEAARERWVTTDVLIVDEGGRVLINLTPVSMLSASMLKKLEILGQVIREDRRPFGGLQVVFSGDFLQLPPVPPNGPRSWKQPVQFAFDADCWTTLFPSRNTVTLTSVFRQKDDRFIKTLEGMRRGNITEEQDALLRSLDRPLCLPDGIEPVELFSRKEAVTKLNHSKLDALPGGATSFTAIDEASEHIHELQLKRDAALRKLDDMVRCPSVLNLKIGAQVMLVKNDKETGLVNGSTGIVVGFASVPQAAKEGIRMISDIAEERYNTQQVWPLVKFNKHKSHKYVPEVLPVPRMTFNWETQKEEVIASRRQVPLTLAWAMTIHKSQGVTLDYVRVNLEGTFADGQAYVACSRVTSLEGLELQGYKRHRVMASKRVLQWERENVERENENDEWEALCTSTDLP